MWWSRPLDNLCLLRNISFSVWILSDVSSLTLLTDDVVVILQEDNSIILNCTYQNDSKEEMENRNIIWQKQIEGDFKDLAVFSPPGGATPFLDTDVQHQYDYRTTLFGPNTSLSAVMIIKDPVCSDEGIYRCWIQYFLGNSRMSNTSRSVVEFKCKYLFIIHAG